MATEIEICNLSLLNLGTSKRIVSLTERSVEAQALSAFYDIALKATCRDFTWPFTKRFLTLALVETNPTTEWGFSYRYPNNCVQIKRILSGNRNDNRQTRVPFIESHDDSGKLILTDSYQAVIECAVKPTNVSTFPPDFVLAFSFRLSHYIAATITGGNAFSGLKDAMMKGYLNELSLARGNAANETQPDILPESEFITGRD